jgi:hypothetical protein
MAMGAPSKELGLQAGQGTKQITCNYTRPHGMQSRVFRMENVRRSDKKRQSRRLTTEVMDDAEELKRDNEEGFPDGFETPSRLSLSALCGLGG